MLEHAFLLQWHALTLCWLEQSISIYKFWGLWRFQDQTEFFTLKKQNKYFPLVPTKHFKGSAKVPKGLVFLVWIILEVRSINLALHDEQIMHNLQWICLTYLLYYFASSKSSRMCPKYCISKHILLENQEHNNAMKDYWTRNGRLCSTHCLGWGHDSWLLPHLITLYRNQKVNACALIFKGLLQQSPKRIFGGKFLKHKMLKKLKIWKSLIVKKNKWISAC